MKVKATFETSLEIVLEEETPESNSLIAIQERLVERIKGYNFLVDVHNGNDPTMYEPKLSLKEIRLKP